MKLNHWLTILKMSSLKVLVSWVNLYFLLSICQKELLNLRRVWVAFTLLKALIKMMAILPWSTISRWHFLQNFIWGLRFNCILSVDLLTQKMCNQWKGGPDAFRFNVKLQLFSLIAKQPAFHQLRSVEQLGYITVLMNRWNCFFLSEYFFTKLLWFVLK